MAPGMVDKENLSSVQQLNFKEALSRTLKTMNIKQLKPKQEEAVHAFILGKDVLVVLPTGYGKSIIYAILPLLYNNLFGTTYTGSVVVVISPLITLMVDQKRNFIHKGITVEFVGDAQDSEEATKSVIRGDVQLVYISPESILNNRKFRNMLQNSKYQEKLVALVVDEVHCVQMWGESFRRAFFEIGTLRSLIKKSVNIMALTATATRQTVSIIKLRLAMDDPYLVGLNSDRSNIKYSVIPSGSADELTSIVADELLAQRLKTPKTIIFCQTLHDCAEIFASIKTKLGINITEPPGLPNILELRLITLFTAASTKEMRDMTLLEFSKVESVLRVVVASSAFGMGIDIPNIARVINWGVPSTLEDLVQQTGRAGRNGSQAEAILYNRNTTRKTLKVAQEYVDNQSLCRRYLLFKDFLYSDHKETVTPCQCCDLCTPMCSCSKCNDSF